MNQSGQHKHVHFLPAPALALTFLFAGMGYASPLLLFPKYHPLNGPVSQEVLNLYFLVAWMGLAHFIFAYEGQVRTLLQGKSKMSLLFVAGLLLGAAILLLSRNLFGAGVFSAVVWIYFIPHFIKAEVHFSQTFERRKPHAWSVSWFPTLGFAFLSFALFAPKTWTQNGWLLFGIAFLCIAGAAPFGIFHQLQQRGSSMFALLGFFFIGEGLVWGTYAKYMSPQFRDGVYAFHIAVASFYHYFRSYGFVIKRMEAKPVAERYLLKIVAINAAVILAGWLVLQNEDWHWPQFVFGFQFFTFWVGLHLVSSDAFSQLRRLT